MSKICTTIKQSKELINLGFLDVCDADMHYFYRDGGSYGLCVGFPPLNMPSGYDVIDARIPAWSLSALLEWVKIKAIAFDEDASVCLESYGLEWVASCMYTCYDGSCLQSDPVDAVFKQIINILKGEKNTASEASEED